MSYQSVTVTLVDESTDPVENAKITLSSYNSGALFGTETTDSNGEAAFSLSVEPGLVEIQAEKEGLVFSKTSCVVLDNDVEAGDYEPQTFTVTGTVLEVGPESPDKGTCLVFGTLISPSGRPLENTPVILTTLGHNRSALVGVGGTTMGENYERVGVPKERIELRTSSDGYWEVSLLAGVYVNLQIPGLGYETTFRVPSKEKLHFGDIRPWSTGSAKPNTGSPFGSGQ